MAVVFAAAVDGDLAQDLQLLAVHKVHDLVLSVDVHQLEAIVAIAATGVAQDAAIQRPDLFWRNSRDWMGMLEI